MPLPDPILTSVINSPLGSDFAQRKEKKLWTSCSKVVLASFMNGKDTIRVVIKKSRVEAKYFDQMQKEYWLIKQELGEIVPNQAFFLEKYDEYKRDMVTAFCVPVSIAYDIFSSEENWRFLLDERACNLQLQNDIDIFIAGYKRLRNLWLLLDLYGDENLVVTREWRLRYIDSFFVNFSERKSLLPISERNFQKIEKLWTTKKIPPLS